ncbi:hypothetical protein Pcinc_017768 [Petrolisthes cinctipes]|uniref:Uncharacterized protein n=1 Tax=Petrolisthes cinctipes TaxID=88211 RepID=A0AAE1KPJ7_PETCI|nr:hypothetical protein Pcinc_017768 [Petrolisthes cinctipes]
MEYSGPAAIAEVEHDLSDNEEQAMEHWPPLKPPARHEFQSVAASTSTKRPKDYGSDTSGEPQSPAAKLTNTHLRGPVVAVSCGTYCVNSQLPTMPHFVLSFVWMPSHIGLAWNDTVDSLAKAACTLGFGGGDAQPSLRCTVQRRDEERGDSVSIQHHDNFLQNRHKYRRHGLMVRRHNVVSARLRLGYRPVWQVANIQDIPHYTSCKLCNSLNANNLEHYCLQCPTVRNLLPQGRNLLQTCQYILSDDNLNLILARHPHFGGF